MEDFREDVEDLREEQLLDAELLREEQMLDAELLRLLSLLLLPQLLLLLVLDPRVLPPPSLLPSHLMFPAWYTQHLCYQKPGSCHIEKRINPEPGISKVAVSCTTHKLITITDTAYLLHHTINICMGLNHTTTQLY